MLIFILAATTVAADVPPAKAKPPCPAAIFQVSKDTVPKDAQPSPLPRANTDSKGPAVLMPACKAEPGKKKDYPMA
jgi:hypothetical protein